VATPLNRQVAALQTEIQQLRNTIIMPTTVQTAISLFSGAGGDTLGLERAGLKVIAFNEFNEAATKTHVTTFPSSVSLVDPATGASDIKKVPDSVFESYKGRANLIFSGFPCFVAGTRVLTQNGYKPIETITLEDTLLTHTGTFQSIVNLQQKVYNRSLFQIRIKYHPEHITTTEEHPFYVRRRVRTWNNSRRAYEFSFKEPEWRAANTLTRDDVCGMVINRKEQIPSFEIVKHINKSKRELIIKRIETPDEWFMMGYFIGDGWIQETLKSTGASAHVIRFAFHKSDLETLDRIQRVLPITNQHCSTGQCDKYGCANMIWFTILKTFGKYAHGKRIPEWVHDAPPALLQHFIDGYLAADGCQKKNMLSFTTVSPHLALGLQRLYLKLGHIASVQKSIRPPTCVIQGRTVNQRDTYETCLYPQLIRKQTAFIEGDYAWMPIASITEQITEPIPVYNCEVATDNSYIVDNTIVHNCQGFSHAGKKKSDDKRNELVHEFVRATRIIQPEWIIGENVKGLLSRKGRLTADSPLRPVIEIIQELFESIGYKLDYRVIDVSTIGIPQNRKRLILVGHRGTLYPHVPWDTLEPASSPSQSSIRPFLESHLLNAMELPTLYKPQDQPTHYWIPTTETVATGTPHKNLSRLVRGLRNRSSKEKEADPTAENQVIEPAGLISFGVRKGGYHGMVVNPDVPCNTIISTYNLCPRLFVGLYNSATKKYWIRTMTPKELGQIQGFPKDYAWQGTDKEKIIQIGNAVPPPLAERLANTIKVNRVVLQGLAPAPPTAAEEAEDEEAEAEAEAEA